jgi:uncharacterized protein (TIGR03435 family)
MKRIVASIGIGFLAACVALGQGRPEFEVATVKLNTSGDNTRSGGILPGGQFAARNISLYDLIRFAYNVRDEYIVGAPNWLRSERVDITAKAPPGTPDPTLHLMLQPLLAQEFKLAVHQERRPMDVWVLTVAKNGPKLQKSAGSGPPDCKRTVTPQLEAEANCKNMTMADFGAALERLAPTYVDREVVDSTGLTGTYDLKLNWVGRDMVDQGGLTMFDALDKMLALKLERQKRPVSVIVIDRVEKLADK